MADATPPVDPFAVDLHRSTAVDFRAGVGLRASAPASIRRRHRPPRVHARRRSAAVSGLDPPPSTSARPRRCRFAAAVVDPPPSVVLCASAPASVRGRHRPLRVRAGLDPPASAFVRPLRPRSARRRRCRRSSSSIDGLVVHYRCSSSSIFLLFFLHSSLMAWSTVVASQEIFVVKIK
uniref:Uncharacterized protein n=1 Tax=Leersia perrieri TaxID=77586 RepID=A0A0D9XV15_9ORYZ